MIPVTTFAGKKVALFGLGASGLASAKALVAGGAEVVAFDDDPGKIAQAKAAGIAIADLRQIDWTGIAAFVQSPGVPLTHPAPHWTVALARNNAVEVIGDIELFCRERRRHAPQASFVAITGTNGKSTTTALTAHLVQAAGYDAQLGGNIGTAGQQGLRAGETRAAEAEQSDPAPGERGDRDHAGAPALGATAASGSTSRRAPARSR